VKLVRRTVVKKRSFLEGGSKPTFLEGCQNPQFWTRGGGDIQDWRKNETCQSFIIFGEVSKPSFLDPRKGDHPGLEEK